MLLHQSYTNMHIKSLMLPPAADYRSRIPESASHGCKLIIITFFKFAKRFTKIENLSCTVIVIYVMPYSLSYSNNKLVQYILSRLSMVYKAFMVSINPKNHESFPLKIIFIYSIFIKSTLATR